LFKQWCDNVDQVATSRLNDFILVESDTKEISVNFHPDLAAFIRETKYLDKLGYTIPETALSITLQVC
jgi:dynein heavy chain, axonemal